MIPSALTALSMIRAIDLSGAAPIVRVPWNDPGIIGRVLDAGALGVVIPMIQSAQAFEEVDAIASTPGVDAIFVGPFDLSIALGLAPGDNDGKPAFDQAISKIAAAAKKAGIATAVLSNAKVAPLRLKQGFQMVSVVTDINALTATARADLETVRPVASEA